MGNDNTLVKVENLTKTFRIKRNVFLKAVDNTSFEIKSGETLGLVGESGCGKSTLGRCILRLIEPTGGTVEYNGTSMQALKGEELRQMRKKMQMVFQNPYSSLNPRMTIMDSVKAPLDVFNTGSKEEREQRVKEIMSVVGLDSKYLYRYPHEFSGGQRQRIVIARALISNPGFIVCDEPVSALDVSIRSQILNLMRDIQNEFGVAYLFISHDLSVVKHISNRIAVMYLGQIVEISDVDRLYEEPLHPYTQALISAIPIPDVGSKRERIILTGDIPSPIFPPTGCRFHNRCRYATERCRKECPTLKDCGIGHQAACHLYD
ncbi:ABC transporter ATP-binding protein [Eisenbergiella tayi]|uniref:ABC transporter ATP-binding protein n=1 Tax=Eisenbergiella tayi TaxID=1432052 RepID=UPI00021347EF|nr:dipeptide ABC transporter ATP-binding protein [Eisenbergiella tayi]EGN32366.1 oligopeptide/dipeptide ABC transporter, ATP-binding protein domain [Lachnospiraceae bacterium 3_1_57FAA_CT1]